MWKRRGGKDRRRRQYLGLGDVGGKESVVGAREPSGVEFVLDGVSQLGLF